MVVDVSIHAKLQAQVSSDISLNLKWNGIFVEITPYDTVSGIDLESGVYDSENPGIPSFVQLVPAYSADLDSDVELLNVKTAFLTSDELRYVKNLDLGPDFRIQKRMVQSRENANLCVEIFPFRKIDGKYEKLMSARLLVSLVDKPMAQSRGRSETYASQSVLSSGKWYKIGLQSTGLYKLTYSDLSTLGLNLSGLNPKNIRVYHNGGGVLPEMNADFRPDDLCEIPIFVSGEADGSFDQNDYILFYGRGPVVWKYDSHNGIYQHQQNAYDDYAYAFITTSLGEGKRIALDQVENAQGSDVISDFLDYQVHESDDYNLTSMGRSYYGDLIDGNGSKEFTFYFPNHKSDKSAKVNLSLAGRNFKIATFQLYIDEFLEKNYSIAATTATNPVWANICSEIVSFAPKNDKVVVTLKHMAVANTTALGYVDYIALNVWRDLKFSGAQMCFRNPTASNANAVYKFQLKNADAGLQVWNVTNPREPKKVNGQLDAGTLTFSAVGSAENEFIAFNGSQFLTPKLLGSLPNQNLHGLRNVDYLIVTYPDFISQAERLKALHNVLDPDLKVEVTTPQVIYNEFSCGAMDVTAIRDFCRMLYLDSDPGKELKYLLLLGDASFDYKNRSEIVNFVPAYETVTSLNTSASIVTDDYFGCFDENEGSMDSSIADIGIGRFPVSNLTQATQMVDKIEAYVSKNESSMGAWRNVITFVADDAESSFIRDAEDFSEYIRTVGGENLIVDKIYLDAYTQVNTPSGQLAPEVNEAINNRMEKGTLVLNYSGHGGEVQLTEERILQRADIQSWRNAPMYPLMITGTCEFSRYDDHGRPSVGEYSFLNQYGGMIAMFTTSRITYGSNNRAFNMGVYKNLFGFEGGNRLRLGDVYRMAKTTGRIWEKRYVFFGDPALRLAYPKWSVVTTKINGHNPASFTDTIKALQEVVLEGQINDMNGNFASDYNGMVRVSVYDKESVLTTKGDENGPVVEFKLRNSVVFNGKTKVENGKFSIRFTVPRDISYRFGRGLINYYATDYENDANGAFSDFYIGGFDENALSDENPPAIRLFIDDTLFVNGGLTNENPTLLAFIEDESGINTTGNGIGHDIVATLTGASNASFCLNDYFESEFDDQGKGTINHKMLNLPEGEYILTLKVWDIYNNSNQASINFVVSNSNSMTIENPICAPNPTTGETRFYFDHNQVGNNMDVTIRIFDVLGRSVASFTDVVYGTTARTNPIYWDGKTSNGADLASGMYIFRIIAVNEIGEMSSAASKLIIKH
jgi:hypothetical protein